MAKTEDSSLTRYGTKMRTHLTSQGITGEVADSIIKIMIDGMHEAYTEGYQDAEDD